MQWWEQLQTRCKGTSISFSKKKRWLEELEERTKRTALARNRQIAVDDTRSTDFYCAIQNKFSAIEHNKLKAAIIRAKAKYVTESDKSTTYFLGLDKSKQSRAYTVYKTLRNKNDTISNYTVIL